MPLAPGTRLGPYELQGLLGAGGMGEVYRARDTRLGRDVAVKILPSGLSQDADRLQRFEHEARAAGQVNHPNILALYDVGRHGGTPYVVSELLEGQTLRERLDGTPLSVRKAVEIAVPLARGLAAAHDKGIVHRDLKPENVFITRDGQVKILDFGLAKLTHSELPPETSALATATRGTDPGTVLGTVGYMSPEQVRGQAADPRSDIFAFGAILYEMLSGRRAFKRETAADTMTAILNEEPPELSQSSQSVPPALDRIGRRCLEKRREARFHSASDLAFALEALSDVSAGKAAAVTSDAAAGRLRRHLRTVVVLGAVGLAGLVVGQRVRPIRFVSGADFTAPPASLPTYHRLTFRRGWILSARFAPDGKNIVHSAAWAGGPPELFMTNADSPESRPLALPNTNLQAISQSGDLALVMGPRLIRGSAFAAEGTLARVPLTGGAPRELLERIKAADWVPGTSDLMVVRNVKDRLRLELPTGHVVYEVPNLVRPQIVFPRVSPKGDRVAFFEGVPPQGKWSLNVVDRAGTKRTLSRDWGDYWGLAWTPGGNEVWFAASRAGGATSLYAVDLEGRQRVVAHTLGTQEIHDTSTDGRALFARASMDMASMGGRRGEVTERDLSWFEGSTVGDVSPDGNVLVITETGEGGGRNYSVYLRRTDGSSPVRLGEGVGHALSPDGRWVATTLVGPPARLFLLPTAAGDIQSLPGERFEAVHWIRWCPDGKRLVLSANEARHSAKLYLLDIATGAISPLTSEGWDMKFALSPDGLTVAALDPQSNLVLLSLTGGESRAVPGTSTRDSPVQWSADGRFLFVANLDETPARVYRVDLASGQRTLWKEIKPMDSAGIIEIYPILITPDGQSYFYSYRRIISDLYLAEGVR